MLGEEIAIIYLSQKVIYEVLRLLKARQWQYDRRHTLPKLREEMTTISPTNKDTFHVGILISCSFHYKFSKPLFVSYLGVSIKGT